MADQLQLRGGTTAQTATFTGALREVTVDTDKDTLVVHDNALAGGYPLLRQDLSNLPAGTIDNADINASAAIVDTKLATIATGGKVSNSATTATNANTASAIVARDASGNFTAGTITAAVTGAASSNVLKAGDTMTGALVVPLASAATPSLTFTGDLDTGVFSPGANQLAVATNGTQRITIDSSGRLLAGTATNITSQQIQSASTGGNNFGASRFTNGLGGCDILLTKSRGATVGTHTVVQSGDDLGNLYFGGSDGSSYVNAARISAAVDGTPGSNDMPGRLVFSTTADGASTPTERLRITSAGLVGIGTSSPGQKLHIVASSGVNNCVRAELSGTAAYQTEAGRFVNTDTGTGTAMGLYVAGTDYGVYSNSGTNFFGGNVGIGTTSPVHKFVVSNSGANGMEFAPSTGDIFIYNRSTSAYTNILFNCNEFIVKTNGTNERVRVDSSGRLLVGTSSARSNVREGTDSETPKVQFESASNDYSGAGLSIINNSSSGFAPQLWLGRSASDSIGGNALVSSGRIGSISFNAADGTNFIQGARIQAELDETSGPGDLPTRLIFSTTANAASTPTERMRLTSEGRFFVPGVWDFSTSSGTAVLVTSDDQIRKAASSIKYKTDVEELQDSYADQILNIRPVWYRSLCDGDDPNHSYWGFIAEEVAEIDPRLTTWKFHNVSYDENGSRVVTKLDNPEPEGVAYDRFVPHLLNLVKRQQQAIETLEAKVAALESA
jgi:hypothetical protein